MLWHSKNFSPEQKTVNEQKAQIMIHSSTENFQPEPQYNSEQKADGLHVSQSIANAIVSGSNLVKGMTVYDEKGKDWIVLSCDDLHNVHFIKKGKGLLINVKGKDIECGGSDLCCYVEDCDEFKNNRAVYYCH